MLLASMSLQPVGWPNSYSLYRPYQFVSQVEQPSKPRGIHQMHQRLGGNKQITEFSTGGGELREPGLQVLVVIQPMGWRRLEKSSDL
jgi:hypothetical protein